MLQCLTVRLEIAFHDKSSASLDESVYCSPLRPTAPESSLHQSRLSLESLPGVVLADRVLARESPRVVFLARVPELLSEPP